MNCLVLIPTSTDKVQTLTVGQDFHVQCKGEIPQFDKSRLQLVLAPETPEYSLMLKDLEVLTPGEVLLRVYSYRVGDHQLNTAKLVDDAHQLILPPLQFKLVSVLPSENLQAGKAIKPFGPEGPFLLPIHPGLLGFLTVCFFAIFLFGFRWKKARKHRLERILFLASLKSDENPRNELLRSMGRALRAGDVMGAVAAFERFCQRHFQIMDLAELQSPIFWKTQESQSLSDFRFLRSETEVLKQKSSVVLDTDLKNFSNRVLKWAEGLK